MLALRRPIKAPAFCLSLKFSLNDRAIKISGRPVLASCVFMSGRLLMAGRVRGLSRIEHSKGEQQMAFQLALSEEILLSVEKPERYLGNEVNVIRKDREGKIRFAMCFPDVYEIGMSHLGIQILYEMFNRREDTWCERVYAPWPDLDQICRRQRIPLFALESQDRILDFDFLGITLQYELCYSNILQILDLSGIPLLARDRLYVREMKPGAGKEGECVQDLSGEELKTGEGSPIVIGGGPCAYNPEPIAAFFDLFYIGEGETVYGPLLDLYKACKEEGVLRREFLRRAASEIPGIYAPMYYTPNYHEDGTLESFLPNAEGVPSRVQKQLVRNLDEAPYMEKPLVPFMRVTAASVAAVSARRV